MQYVSIIKSELWMEWRFFTLSFQIRGKPWRLEEDTNSYSFTSYPCRQKDICEWWRWCSTPPLPQASPSAGAAASAGFRCAGASWNGRVGWGSTWPWWSSYTGHSGSSTTRPPQRSRAAANAVVREWTRESVWSFQWMGYIMPFTNE